MADNDFWVTASFTFQLFQSNSNFKTEDMIKTEFSSSKPLFGCTLDSQSAQKILRYRFGATHPSLWILTAILLPKERFFFTKRSFTEINWKCFEISSKWKKRNCRKKCEKRPKTEDLATLFIIKIMPAGFLSFQPIRILKFCAIKCPDEQLF